jgi:hypothetical protein
MFWIVFFSLLFSIVALFWDELVITTIAHLLGRNLSSRFLFVWVVASGILATVLITIHAPPHLRVAISTLGSVLLLTFVWNTNYNTV